MTFIFAPAREKGPHEGQNAHCVISIDRNEDRPLRMIRADQVGCQGPSIPIEPRFCLVYLPIIHKPPSMFLL